MGSGSFGLQIGAQDAEVIMLLMNNTALNAFLNSQFKIGADAGVSVATLGAGIGGSSGTALGADIVTFAKSRGLYGGISLSGSVFSNDAALDQQYYGQTVGPRQIVVNMTVNNAGANPLRAMLAKYGG
jgi:lipid-binding SYLF domain-containing protein